MRRKCRPLVDETAFQPAQRTGALVLLVCAWAASCSPQLEVVVVRAEGFTGPVQYVKLHVVAEGRSDPEVYGPFSTDAVLDEQFAAVPPETAFYIDIMGCLGPKPEECDDDVEFIARGCSAWQTLTGNETTRRVEVELDRAVVGAERCPPVRTEDDGG